MLVSDKKDKAWVMMAFQYVTQFSDYEFLRLEGLDPNKRYRVLQLNKSFSGAALMNLGLPIPTITQDYGTFTFDLEEE
jgi:alpha-galactosidase